MVIISEQDSETIDTSQLWDKFTESAGVGYNAQIVNNNLALPLAVFIGFLLLSKA